MVSKKQLTELQQEAYNLEMANRRLHVQIDGLQRTTDMYRENCRMAIAKMTILEDEIATKDRLIDLLTAERDRLKLLVKSEAYDAYWEASDNNRSDRWSSTFDEDVHQEFEKYWETNKAGRIK